MRKLQMNSSKNIHLTLAKTFDLMRDIGVDNPIARKNTGNLSTPCQL